MLLAIHFAENFPHRGGFSKLSAVEFHRVGRVELSANGGGDAPNYRETICRTRLDFARRPASNFVSERALEIRREALFRSLREFKNRAAEKQSNRRARFPPCAPIATRVQPRSLRSASCPGSLSPGWHGRTLCVSCSAERR